MTVFLAVAALVAEMGFLTSSFGGSRTAAAGLLNSPRELIITDRGRQVASTETSTPGKRARGTI